MMNEPPSHKQLRAFREVYRILQRRVRLFTSLQLEHPDRLALQREIRKIGKS
jgi:hypothetical protein